MIKKVKGLNQLQELANLIAQQIKPGDIVCLEGDLGAGKTTMVQMMAKNLGVKDNITSPTFEIAKIYSTRELEVVHIDAYRLENNPNKEMFDEYIYHSGVTFIEWSEFLSIKKFTKKINIKILSENEREIKLNGFIF